MTKYFRNLVLLSAGLFAALCLLAYLLASELLSPRLVALALIGTCAVWAFCFWRIVKAAAAERVAHSPSKNGSQNLDIRLKLQRTIGYMKVALAVLLVLLSFGLLPHGPLLPRLVG